MQYLADKKYVLLVDDDLIVRTAHRKPLLEAGFIVEEAENGQQAIEHFRNHKELFDIIFMDYDMPDMTGADVAKALRRIEGNNKKIPIIGVTTQTDTITKEICLKAGMTEVFSKPLLPLNLTALVNQMV